MNTEKDLVEKIIRSMEENPEEWVMDEYTLTKNNGLSLWISNGMFFNLGVYGPFKMNFSFRAKLKLIPYIKSLKLEKLSNLIARREDENNP